MPPAVRYTPDVEHLEADEAETEHKLNETFAKIVETVNGDYGHAFRAVHAKSHALLEGEVTVLGDLPGEYAQGLFAIARTYPALLRISTNPGDPLPDTISVQRGFALKLLEVEGERLSGSEDGSTQDFVLANGKSFPVDSPKAFLANLKLLAATTDKVEGAKKIASAFFRTIEKGVEALGGESAMLLQMGGYPNSHPLGERYYSQAPIRWGEHIAKVAIVPLSANLKALEHQMIEIAGREDALREEIATVLASEGGEWELRVQLCRDLEANPVERASVAWPEDDNPYVAVATIRVAPQESWTYERARVIDDETAFSPWTGVVTHRPLGQIMRARKPTYAASVALRGRLNGCPIHEPRSAALSV